MKRPRGVTIAAVLVGALGGLSILFGVLALAAVALGGTDATVDAAVFTSLAFSLVIIGYFLTKGVRTAFGR